MINNDLTEHAINRVILRSAVVNQIESPMECYQRLTRIITQIDQVVSDATEGIEPRG